MPMSRIIPTLTFVLVLSTAAFSQAVSEKNATEDAQKLRKEAVVFLRETLADVNGMRSLENRISFTAEMAALMWFYDESEGRAMYAGAIGDFRDLLARYDTQMNTLGVSVDDGDGPGGSPMSFMVEPTEKGRVIRKFTVALAVGQQIALSLAEHDPELAYSFFFDSISSISNPEFRKQLETGTEYFETQLLGQIAETNAAKAAQLAAKSTSKGVTFAHIELLKKIHKKDADKGADFGAVLMSRLKATKKLDSSNFYVLRSLIDFGGQTLEESKKLSGKRPVYTESELRDLVEFFAQAILSADEGEHRGGSEYLDTIQKYSPGRAAQIRAKFKITSTASNSNSALSAGYPMPPPPPMRTSSNSSSNSNSASRREQERMEAEEREKKLFEDMKKLGEVKLPKEERQRIVAQSRKIIMQAQGRDKKVAALSALATQVAAAGDKELAGEIMKDAEALVNPAPKNYQDFLLSWMLASGYASTNPDKAFPILEETIGRANETLSAFIKVGEFVDVAEEMIVDGEVQVGAFGGQMVRGLTSELNVADGTIEVLAKADFAKTKALTNRFDRAEIRVLAKMMVLRAILKPKEVPKAGVAADEISDEDK